MGSPSEENRNLNPARKGHCLSVGITRHEPIRIDIEEKGKENKEEQNMEKERKKGSRRVEDGLLLVVSTRICGKTIKALIHS